MRRSRALVTSVVVLVAAAGATLASATSSSHNAESWGISATLEATAPHTTSGLLSGRITVIRGRRSATVEWSLVSLPLHAPAIETNLRIGAPSKPGRIVAVLCAQCSEGARGRITFPTRRPWFRPGDTFSSVPSLHVEVRAAGGTTRNLRGRVTRRGGWRGFVT